jgi:hypothetical protein
MSKIGIQMLMRRLETLKRSWMNYWSVKNYGGANALECYGFKMGTKTPNIFI